VVKPGTQHNTFHNLGSDCNPPDFESACMFVVRESTDVHTSAPLRKSSAGSDNAVFYAGGSRQQRALAVRNFEGLFRQAPWWRPSIMALLDGTCTLAYARLSRTTMQKLIFNRKTVQENFSTLLDKTTRLYDEVETALANIYYDNVPGRVNKAINGAEIKRAIAHLKRLTDTYTTLATARAQAATILKYKAYVAKARVYEEGLDSLRTFLRMYTETYVLSQPACS
jgi:hypothetical protein